MLRNLVFKEPFDKIDIEILASTKLLGLNVKDFRFYFTQFTTSNMQRLRYKIFMEEGIDCLTLNMKLIPRNISMLNRNEIFVRGNIL